MARPTLGQWLRWLLETRWSTPLHGDEDEEYGEIFAVGREVLAEILGLMDAAEAAIQQALATGDEAECTRIMVQLLEFAEVAAECEPGCLCHDWYDVEADDE